MTRYLVETSVIIEYLRGNTEWVEKLNNLDGEICSSYVCLAELYEGIARDTKGGAEAKILKFFRSLTEVYGIDTKIAENFGRLRADLKRSGKVIEDMDILVAATCKTYGLVLVTVNKSHFQRIFGLEVI